MKTRHNKYSFAPVFTQMSELNLNDQEVFPQARIDVFYCNKPLNFILHEKKPA